MPPTAVFRPVIAALVAGLLPALPAEARDLPPAVQAFADEQADACKQAGGVPSIGLAFATPVDLNGDGALDYIVDLAGLECAGAWSLFCGTAGCPVSVWLAGPDGHSRVWGDYAQGWSVQGTGAETAVIIEQHGTACPGNATGIEPCSQRLTFATGAAASIVAERPLGTDPLDATQPDAISPDAVPAEAAPGPVVALPEPDAEGWTLRAAPDGERVAVAAGSGLATRLAVFCLGGKPWLAVTLADGPGPETLAFEFAFAAAKASAGGEARREEGAGGAYVLDLADSALAGLLAGRDSEARLSIEGTDQGVLSLRGSTRAIRAALASCLAP